MPMLMGIAMMRCWTLSSGLEASVLQASQYLPANGKIGHLRGYLTSFEDCGPVMFIAVFTVSGISLLWGKQEKWAFLQEDFQNGRYHWEHSSFFFPLFLPMYFYSMLDTRGASFFSRNPNLSVYLVSQFLTPLFASENTSPLGRQLRDL